MHSARLLPSKAFAVESKSAVRVGTVVVRCAFAALLLFQSGIFENRAGGTLDQFPRVVDSSAHPLTDNTSAILILALWKPTGNVVTPATGWAQLARER